MNRKWSYVAAMMLTASCGCLFTGCIDNDEPYGIEQIRVATANLLEAKKAAVEAEAAAANAAAEVEKIKAEVEKAKLEVEKIKAEAQAEALKLQAQAEAAKTQAEAELFKAQAESIIKQTEMDALEKQAQIDRYIAKTEEQIKEANLRYERLVYCWEQTKIKHAAAANDALFKAVDTAYQAYMHQLMVYNDANYQLLNAQKALAEYNADLKWVDEKDGKPGHFESNQYKQKASLQRVIAKQQKAIDNANKAIAEDQAAIDKIEKAASTSDLSKLLADYEEKLVANAEEETKAKAELDGLKVTYKADYDAQRDLDAKIEEEKKKEIKVAPYTFEPDPKLEAIGLGEQEIVAEDQKYTLLDIENGYTDICAYGQAKEAYENQIARIKNFMLDDNDKAWTQARINEMTRELTVANPEFEAAKAEWETAKKVYNLGNTPDPSVAPDAEKVKEAADAFNAKATALEPLKAAYIASIADLKAAEEALEKEEEKYYSTTGNVAVYTEAKEAYDAALEKVQSDYQEATSAAETKRDKAINDASLAVYKATRAVWSAQQDLNAAQNELNLDPDNEALKAKLKTAQDAKTAADDALTAANTANNKVQQEAPAAYQKEIAAAQTAAVAGMNAAEVAFNKTLESFTGDAPDGLKAARKVVEDAQSACNAAENDFTTASEELKPLKEAFEAAAQNQLDKLGIGSWDESDFIPDYDAFLYDRYWGLATEDMVLEAPQATLPLMMMNNQGVYSNAKKYVIKTSDLAYGILGQRVVNGANHDYIKPDMIDIDRAFLVDNVTLEMVNNYIRSKYGEDLSDAECSLYYGNYGLYGKVLELQAKIRIAQDVLANPNLVDDAIAPLQANLKALEDSLTNAQAVLETLEDEKADIDKKLEDLESSAKTKLNDLKEEKRTLTGIVNTVANGLAQIQLYANSGDTDDIWKSNAKADVEKMLKELQWDIEEQQNAIEKATTLLDKAKYQLEQYENGYTDIVSAEEINVEYWQGVVDRIKGYVDLLKAHLDDIQAIYEKATKE